MELTQVSPGHLDLTDTLLNSPYAPFYFTYNNILLRLRVFLIFYWLSPKSQPQCSYKVGSYKKKGVCLFIYTMSFYKETTITGAFATYFKNRGAFTAI